MLTGRISADFCGNIVIGFFLTMIVQLSHHDEAADNYLEMKNEF
jgi:hypothetical protein